MLPTYLRYIELNLAPIRKALEKRPIANGLSSEGTDDFLFISEFYSGLIDLLSIPPKQFLQILSQIQVRLSISIELSIIGVSISRIYIKLLNRSNRLIKKASFDCIPMLNDVEHMAYVSLSFHRFELE